MLIELAMPDGRQLFAHVWVAQVGRIPLLLLDSDIGENEHDLRGVTDRLYGSAGHQPDLAEAWLGRCHSLVKLERYADALAAHDKALTMSLEWLRRGSAICSRAWAVIKTRLPPTTGRWGLRADLIEAWFGRAGVLFNLGRFDDALAAYDKVLSLKPDLAEAWLGRGNLLMAVQRYESAPAAYDRALSLNLIWPRRGSVGNLLVRLNRHEEARTAYDKALALKPLWSRHGSAWQYSCATRAPWRGRCRLQQGVGAQARSGGGVAWSEPFIRQRGRFDEALAAIDKALALRPDLAEEWLGRGNALFEQGRCNEALDAYDKALARSPTSPRLCLAGATCSPGWNGLTTPLLPATRRWRSGLTLPRRGLVGAMHLPSRSVVTKPLPPTTRRWCSGPDWPWHGLAAAMHSPS